MDFSYTAEEEAFRSELRAWLEANVPTDPLPATLDEEAAYLSTSDEALKLGGTWFGRKILRFGDFGKCTPDEILASVPEELHSCFTFIVENENLHNEWVQGDSLIEIILRIEIAA